MRFPASFLRLCALSQEDVLEQYANGASEDALDAVAEGDDVILTFTAGQLEAQVRKWEETLAEETASLLERDCADAVDVSDDLRAITVTARPCFTDDNDAAADLYTIMVACGYLQLFDGQEDWGFRAAFVDADTGIEVAAADMPGEGLTISRDIWADALSAAGVPVPRACPRARNVGLQPTFRARGPCSTKGRKEGARHAKPSRPTPSRGGARRGTRA